MTYMKSLLLAGLTLTLSSQFIEAEPIPSASMLEGYNENYHTFASIVVSLRAPTPEEPEGTSNYTSRSLDNAERLDDAEQSEAAINELIAQLPPEPVRLKELRNRLNSVLDSPDSEECSDMRGGTLNLMLAILGPIAVSQTDSKDPLPFSAYLNNPEHELNPQWVDQIVWASPLGTQRNGESPFEFRNLSALKKYGGASFDATQEAVTSYKRALNSNLGNSDGNQDQGIADKCDAAVRRLKTLESALYEKMRECTQRRDGIEHSQVLAVYREVQVLRYDIENTRHNTRDAINNRFSASAKTIEQLLAIAYRNSKTFGEPGPEAYTEYQALSQQARNYGIALRDALASRERLNQANLSLQEKKAFLRNVIMAEIVVRTAEATARAAEAANPQ